MIDLPNGMYDENGNWQSSKKCFVHCGDRCDCGPPMGIYYDRSKDKRANLITAEPENCGCIDGCEAVESDVGKLCKQRKSIVKSPKGIYPYSDFIKRLDDDEEIFSDIETEHTKSGDTD